MVFHQSGLSSEWSLMVVCHQGGLSWWSVIRVVSHGGLSWWSVIRVVCHQGGLSLGWCLIREACYQTGLTPDWSLIKVVFHQGFHCTRWVFFCTLSQVITPRVCIISDNFKELFILVFWRLYVVIANFGVSRWVGVSLGTGANYKLSEAWCGKLGHCWNFPVLGCLSVYVQLIVIQ